MSAFKMHSLIRSSIARRTGSYASSSIYSRLRGRKTPAIFAYLFKPSTFQNLLPREENQRLYFSTNEETSSSQRDNSSKDTETQTEKNDDIILFPWRESAKTPLPRIESKDDLSGFIKSSNYKFFLKLGSCVELGQFNFWSFFISKQWEKELASNTEWAFQTAVAGLISRSFGVPFNSIENTKEDGVVVDLTIPNATEQGADNSDEKMDGKTSEVKEEAKEGGTEMDDSTKFIENMIEENLLSLYAPTTYDETISTTDQEKSYEITFCLKPIASRLENIFIVGVITRDDVKSNPSLKGAYSEMINYNSLQNKDSPKLLRQMAEELTRKTPHSGTKRSIIMDVSIDCAEIFQIKDLSNGKIIQGQGKGESGISSSSLEPEMTSHLVRLELVTSKGQKLGAREIGSWKIIDIDDMLDGNTWH